METLLKYIELNKKPRQELNKKPWWKEEPAFPLEGTFPPAAACHCKMLLKWAAVTFCRNPNFAGAKEPGTGPTLLFNWYVGCRVNSAYITLTSLWNTLVSDVSSSTQLSFSVFFGPFLLRNVGILSTQQSALPL